MRCDVVERELSARLDGDRDRLLDAGVEPHLEACSRCRAFESRAHEIRRAVRLAPAPDVPDLTGRIMAAVEAEEPIRLRGPWRRYVAAFAAGAAVSVLLLGGLPSQRARVPEALAVEIPRRIADASSDTRAYTARFAIVERNFHPEVPERRLTATIAFAAPERFSATISDRTAYPSPQWPANDIRLAVDAQRWSVTGPAACPREALPACATGRTEVRAVEGREPFDGTALLPTDIVLPVRTLAGTDRVEVAGRGSVLGRPTVVASLAYRDAVGLFAYLHTGGLWRPFFPQDRVLVDLEEDSWFPLSYEVRAAGGPERDLWADRNGLPREREGERLLSVRATSLSVDAPEDAFVDVEPAQRHAGFRAVAPSELTAIEPTDSGGLPRYQAGTFADGSRPADEVLVTYARGLSWLKVRQTQSWEEPALFGNIGPAAEPVTLPGGGIAYYEPATATLGRRLSLHAAPWDIFLESNLPRERLLAVAASLPVRGRTAPPQWLVREWPGGIVREQVPIDRAVEPGYVRLPRTLPLSYRFATAHIVRSGAEEGVTLFYRRPGAEMDGIGLRLHQAPGTALPPPMDPDVFTLAVGKATGRYSPERGELQWIDRDVYRSVSAPGLDLATLRAVAESLERPR